MILMCRNSFVFSTLLIILTSCVKEIYLLNENTGDASTSSPRESVESSAIDGSKSIKQDSQSGKNQESASNENPLKSRKELGSLNVTQEKSETPGEKEEKGSTPESEQEISKSTEAEPVVNEPEATETSPTEESEKSSEKPTTETSSTEKEKEKPQIGTFTVLDDKGNVCILAKFEAVFTIIVPEEATIVLPKDASSKGKCDNENDENFLKLTWEKFHFKIEFSKIPDDEDEDDLDDWAVTSLEFKYRPKDVFKETEGIDKNATLQAKDLKLFKTEVGKSYFCPSEEVTLLSGMHASTKVEADVRMKHIHIQPFDVKEGKFSKAERCDLVAIDSEEEPFVRDETAPLAVGLTLSLLTLFTVLGFSIHRAIKMRKVEYNDMS